MSNGQGQGSSVPPSPKDVRIRTMASDIQSMALRGGGSPEYEKILFQEPGAKKKKPLPVYGQPMPSEHGISWTLAWVFGVAAVLAALVFFLYPLITQREPEDPVIPPDDEEVVFPDVPAYLVVPKFTHETLFINEPEEVLSTILGPPVDEAMANGVYEKKVLEVLKTTKTDSGVIQIDLKKTEDQHLALVEFLKLAGAEFIDLEFLSNNFNPDFTFYVYKNGDERWPGLVAKLKPGKSKLLLQSELSKLESSDKISALYLSPPGDKTSGFKDVLVFNEPARIVDFKEEGARFVYGWFHSFFVISTSDEGLLDALLKL